jgi:hypothetical protein
MLSKWHRAFTILFFLIVAACSGGGCSSGCSGCGITPVGREFPAVDQITNAATARVTRTGLDFIATNAPSLAQTILGGTGGVVQFDIPTTPESLGVTVTICPNGSNPTSDPEICTIDLDIGTSTFHVDAVTPDAVTVTGTLNVRAEDLPVSGSIAGIGFDIYVGIGNPATLTCNGNTPSDSGSNPFQPVDYAPLDFTITLPLIADTIAPRVGYTKIDSDNITVNFSNLGSDDVTLCTSCGSICDTILDGLVDIAFDLLSSTIQGYIKTAVQNELCTKASTTTTPACPYGSVNVSGTCMYGPSNSVCLPLELGTDGHIDLATALQSISPGSVGALDFLLAAGGNMIPGDAPSNPTGAPADNVGYTGHTPNGITLGLLGGALPSPQSPCVPQFNNVVPTGIPIPTALEGSNGTDDFGIAIAQRFLNYAFGTVFNSGLLCLGVSTSSEQELESGLLSLLIPSIKDLVFQWGVPNPAAAAVITRPQFPPVATVGDGTNIKTDPLLSIFIKQFAIDFYIFSEDRFVRIFTYTADLTIPVDIESSAGGLLPVIGSITAANAGVTNSELLLDSPDKISTSLTTIIGSVASMLTGSLKPINVSGALASYGLTLNIDSIGKLTQGTDNFLTLWADLSTGGAPMLPIHVGLEKKNVDPLHMSMETFERDKIPSLLVHFSPGEARAGQEGPVEYSYWIDQSTRSAWSTDPDPLIQNDVMFLQGNHILHVAGRLVGQPETETTNPTDLPFTIDVLPPNIDLELDESGKGVTLAAYDFVTPRSALVARYQTTDTNGKASGWSDWTSLENLAKFSPAGSSVTAEVKDQEGNVGSMTIELIRGRANPGQVASSCSCSTPGRGGRGGTERGSGLPAGWAIGLGLLLALAMLRRKSSRGSRAWRLSDGRFASAVGLLAVGQVALAGALSEGCSCGATTTTNNGGKDGSPGGPDAGPVCGPTCNQECLPALPPGLVGAYTSTAKSSKGTIWVAGYNDSAVSAMYSGLYGDLVVGQYDTAKQQVDWVSVDGVPALPKGTCAVYDPLGWRRGISDPGDDVGLWTSIQMDASDHPIVSYYDATNQALKFASSSDGVKWNVHTVMQVAGSDIGRYAKMLVIDGSPTIAFLIMEPGSGGKLTSKVEVATATTQTPSSAADWQFEDAAVDDNGPCRSAFCKAPAVCIASTGSCEAPSTACKGACDSGVCVSTDAGASCETPLASSYIDIYPNAFGDYITLANGPDGLGIAVYDRIDGLLYGVSKTHGSWQSQVIDGWTQPRMPSTGPDGGSDDTGDVGVGASLFIAANGDWHISYVNGTTEALQYILVPGGGKPTDYPEIVDNGLSLDGKAFPDGLHIVGDDSFIMVDLSNVVTIRYQDATAGTLRFATGTPMTGGKHQWAFHAVSQPNKFAGFFPHQLAGQNDVANWWRTADPATGDISGNVSFVSP